MYLERNEACLERNKSNQTCLESNVIYFEKNQVCLEKNESNQTFLEMRLERNEMRLSRKKMKNDYLQYF